MITKTSKNEQFFAYLLLVLPAVVIYFFVVAFPTVFSVFLSLSNYSGGKIFGGETGFAGLKSYREVFTTYRADFLVALQNNMFIVLMSVFGQIPLGFILAYILSRKLIRGVDFFQTVIYLPNIITPVIIGILFQNFYYSGDNSVFMEIVRVFNPGAEFTMPKLLMIPVLLVMLWMYTGMYVIIFLANIQRIDVSVIEAAKIDGATEAQALRYIILPALSGVIVTSAILAISGSLKSFDLLYVMTQGGPGGQTRVLSLFMFDKAFKTAPNYPLANAISTIMVIISFILIGITQMTEKKFGGKE